VENTLASVDRRRELKHRKKVSKKLEEHREGNQVQIQE